MCPRLYCYLAQLCYTSLRSISCADLLLLHQNLQRALKIEDRNYRTHTWNERSVCWLVSFSVTQNFPQTCTLYAEIVLTWLLRKSDFWFWEVQMSEYWRDKWEEIGFKSSPPLPNLSKDSWNVELLQFDIKIAPVARQWWGFVL